MKEENIKYGKNVEANEHTPSGQYSLGSPMQQLRYNPGAYAKYLKRKYGSKIDAETVEKKLKQIVAQDNKSAKAQEDTRQKVYDREGNHVGELTLKERLINELAVEIAESIAPPRTADADEILSHIREKPLLVTDKQEAEIKHHFGTLANFRKDTGVRVSNPKDSAECKEGIAFVFFACIYDLQITMIRKNTEIQYLKIATVGCSLCFFGVKIKNY